MLYAVFCTSILRCSSWLWLCVAYRARVASVEEYTMGAEDHEQRAQAEAPASIRCGVITISDTRTPETDASGAAIRAALEGGGHAIVRYAVARDEPAEIVALVRELSAAGCQVIL